MLTKDAKYRLNPTNVLESRMDEFIEIFFCKLKSKGNGDAICINYGDSVSSSVHLVDGGYKKDGKEVVDFLKKLGIKKIDNVIVTHNDRDHANGLQYVLEKFPVDKLWMNRPWCFVNELINVAQQLINTYDSHQSGTVLAESADNEHPMNFWDKVWETELQIAAEFGELSEGVVLSQTGLQQKNFSRMSSKVHQLKKIWIPQNRLQIERDLIQSYKSLYKLDEIATELDITVSDAFQSQQIGEFIVVAPNDKQFFELVVMNEFANFKLDKKTALDLIETAKKSDIVRYELVKWGAENFKKDKQFMNNMSIVQFGQICDQNILLTADTSEDGLIEAANYVKELHKFKGLQFSGIDIFQVPHHGSQYNLSEKSLDSWLFEKLEFEPKNNPTESFSAIVSASKSDDFHPSKVSIRAMIHRGGKVFTNEDSTLRCPRGNAPDRGFQPADNKPYPSKQEV